MLKDFTIGKQSIRIIILVWEDAVNLFIGSSETNARFESTGTGKGMICLSRDHDLFIHLNGLFFT